MKTAILLSGLSALVLGQSPFYSTNTTYYNILSLDGGAMRNLITLEVLTYMEEYAQEYAVMMGYVPANIPVGIKDIFHMIAGTSTGGVIAASLSVPINEFKNESNPASVIRDTFIKHGPSVFEQQTINTGLIIILTLVSCLMGGGLGY